MLYILLSLFIYPMLYLAGRGRRREAPRILIIQTAKIGDLVCSTPVFREIRRHFPSAHIGVMADPGSCAILEANSYLDEVIPVAAGDVKGFGGKARVAGYLRRERFNISVCLLPNLANTIVPLWALIPRRISVIPERAGITLRAASILSGCIVRHSTQRSIVRTYVELLHEGLSIPVREDSTRLELETTDRAARKAVRLLTEAGIGEKDLVVGMAPAARNKLKEVPALVFAAVADEIQEKFSARVVLTGGGGDMGRIKEVMERMSGRAVNTAGKVTLSELPALLERMALFISVDSGPVYMAAALGVPFVNIAGPCAMSERPLGKTCLVVQKTLPCAPCSYTLSTARSCKKGDRECVNSITPEEVLDAAVELLKGRATGGDVAEKT